MKKHITKETYTESQAITQELKKFYNNEAKKYTSTRKKYRADANKLITILETLPQQHLSILDLGCGSGRTLDLLGKLSTKTIQYTGVDISEQLLIQAKETSKLYKHIKASFKVDDMIHFGEHAKQESYDLVLAIASIQHLPTPKERLILLKYLYKLVNYEGLLITTNRSYSLWFLRVHRKVVLESLRKMLSSLHKRQRNDCRIPRKQANKQSIKRYYHLFTLSELREIARKAGFIISELTYLDKQGLPTTHRTQSNNSLLVAKKTIEK